MIDPLSAEALRLVGNRKSLRTARAICLDIGANGPATALVIAQRMRRDRPHVQDLLLRMVRVGWLTHHAGTYDVIDMPDPFPRDL